MFTGDDNDGGLLLSCLFVKILEPTVADSHNQHHRRPLRPSGTSLS